MGVWVWGRVGMDVHDPRRGRSVRCDVVDGRAAVEALGVGKLDQHELLGLIDAAKGRHGSRVEQQPGQTTGTGHLWRSPNFGRGGL